MVGKLRCFACKKQNEPKYSFPRDENRLKQWLKILSLVKRPKKSSRICEEHFQIEDLFRTEKKGYFKVQKDALPLIYHKNSKREGVEMESIDIKSKYFEVESFANSVGNNNEKSENYIQESFNDKENDIEDQDKIESMFEVIEAVDREIKTTKPGCQGTDKRALRPKKPRNTAPVKSYARNPNGVNTKAKQLRLASGELKWALPIGVEPIPGSKKNRIMYKVLGPVVPGQLPPTIIIRPKAASEGGTISASSPPTQSINNFQLLIHDRKQSIETKSNEDVEERLKLESIELKTEGIQPDTFSSTESNDCINDGHIVLFNMENHDENNLIKQELEQDPLS